MASTSYLQALPHGVDNLLPSPDGSIVVASCFNGAIRFYNHDCAVSIAEISYPGRILSMCWAKVFGTEPVLACLCSDGNVWLREVDSAYIPVPGAEDTVIYSARPTLPEGTLVFDTEGGQLAVGCPGHLTVWSLNFQVPTCRAGLETDGNQSISHIHFLSQRKILVFFRRPGYMVEHDLETNTIMSTLRICPAIVCVGSSDPDLITVVGEDSGLGLYLISAHFPHSTTGAGLHRILEGSTSRLLSTALILPREDVVICGTQSGEVVIWNISSGQISMTFQTEHAASVTALAVFRSPGVASIDGLGRVRVIIGSKQSIQVCTARLPFEVVDVTSTSVVPRSFFQGEVGTHGSGLSE